MKYQAHYLCRTNDAEGWSHFLWSVEINGERFEYRTGIGLATPYVSKAGKRNKKPDIECIAVNTEAAWLHVPRAEHVLDALMCDAECGERSFDDFCSDMGLSNDSISAFNTYRACSEAGRKLRKALGKEYQAEANRISKLREDGVL